MTQRSAFVLVVIVLMLLALGASYLYTNGAPSASTISSHTHEQPLPAPVVSQQTGAMARGPVEQIASGVEVSGRVIDGAGQVIAGTELRLEPAGLVAKLSENLPAAIRVLVKTVSDADGIFSLRLETADGDFTLSASKPSYAPLTQTLHIPPEGVKNIEIVLSPAASISGNVVDLAGKPLEYTSVSAVGTASSKTVESHPSNANGEFEILDLGADTYRLRARFLPPQRGRWNHGIALDSTTAEAVKVKLEQGEQRKGVRVVVPWLEENAIEGRVSDSDGKALEGATIWAERAASPTASSLAGFCKAGPSGQYRMETLRSAEEERDYTMDVWASFPGYEDGVCRNVMPGSKADIVLAAEAFGAIEGQVLEQQSRRPISEARVILWNVNRNNGVQKSFYDGLSKQVRSGGGHVDSKGRFRIERVPAGHATLLVESTHYGFSRQDVAVSSGETTTTEVLLDAPGRLEVNVVYTGAMEGRRAQCEVTCRPKGSSGEGPQFSTYLQDVFSGEEPAPDGMRDAGTHVFSLEPGTYDVVVATRVPEGVNARAYRLFEAEVRSGQTTTVEAEVGGSGVVSGHVNRGETEGPVRVYLVSEPELEPDEFQAGFPTAAKLLTNRDYVHSCSQLDQDGNYFFYCIPFGKYPVNVLVEQEGGEVYLRQSKSVTVETKEPVRVDFQ